MESIRILLGSLPPMLHDIVAGLVGRQDDMRIVGELTPDSTLRSCVSTFEPHVIIVGAASSDVPADIRDLVRDECGIKVLAVQADGRHAWLYELRPHQVRIGEVSAQTLIETIRATSTVTPVEVHHS